MMRALWEEYCELQVVGLSEVLVGGLFPQGEASARGDAATPTAVVESATTATSDREASAPGYAAARAGVGRVAREAATAGAPKKVGRSDQPAPRK